MNDRENFLSRWARRKRDVAKDGKDSPDAGTDIVPAKPDSPDPRREAVIDHQGERPALPASPEEEKPGEPLFDISKLPSIESITAETDIRPFLVRGVPAALRQAALRRMWVADPKIRDFIEMAENQWDFTGASEIPGFDFSPPTGDVKRMLSEILRETPGPDEKSQAQSDVPRLSEADPGDASNESESPHRDVTGTSSDDEIGDAASAPMMEPAKEPVRQTLVAHHDEPNVASQKNDAAQESKIESPRRSHGRALPK
jgi:hypothetical protein